MENHFPNANNSLKYTSPLHHVCNPIIRIFLFKELEKQYSFSNEYYSTTRNILSYSQIDCKHFFLNVYEHCELSVNNKGILDVAETSEPYDVSVIHRMKWQTMTFNAFELESTDAVRVNILHYIWCFNLYIW